jgi:hypothetical protein
MTPSADRIKIQPAIAVSVRFADGRLFVRLADDREIGVPIREFPRLASATDAQRDHWKVVALGTGIRWPDIDEDIGVAGLLGVPEDLVEEAAGFTTYDFQPPDA